MADIHAVLEIVMPYAPDEPGVEAPVGSAWETLELWLTVRHSPGHRVRCRHNMHEDGCGADFDIEI
jgi:hypothetical protein